MYYYIYDNFLKHKKYNSLLSKIENRLTDLGINGRISRLSLLTSLKELVEENIKRGVKTIVAVGNNQTINKVLAVVAPKNQLTLGIIPIGPNNQLAELLGIPEGEAACDILSARKIEKLDLGLISPNLFFISSVVTPSAGTILDCDNQYRIIPLNKHGQVIICNFYNQSFINNPQNGVLKVLVGKNYQKGILKKFIRKEEESVSVFTVKKIEIDNLNKKSVPLIVDGQAVSTTPAIVKIIPQKLKVVVGKERVF